VSIFAEFRRRNVFRSGAAYLAASWLLIQLVNEIGPILAFPDSVGRIVLIVLAIGFIPALILSWVFELTPGGIKREAASNQDANSDRASTRNFDRAIIVVLTLAVSLFAVDRFLLNPASNSVDSKTIAVLAFEDLSQAGDQEYWSDGISETILDLLAGIPDLRVTARTSAFSFKGKDATVAEIAQVLGVRYVLEGSVRTDGEQIRVTAQLIDAATQTHVWSETYDRKLGSVFAIQDDIAGRIIDALDVSIRGNAPAADETDPETYERYLQARHINRNIIVGSLPLARELLQEAIERDPNYLPARYQLAYTYVYIEAFARRGQLPGEDAAEANVRSVQIMEEAATLAPDRPEIYAWRGWLAGEKSEWATAARYLERALSQKADMLTLGPAASTLLRLSRYEQAIEVVNYALARDPIWILGHEELIFAHFVLRQYDKVQEAYARARALGFSDIGRDYAAFSLLFSGDAEAALAMFQDMDAETQLQGRLAGSAMALYALGRMDEFRATFDELIRLVDAEVPRLVVIRAAVYLYIGEDDAAFEVLQQMTRGVDPTFYDSPFFARIRNHPRWPELAREAQLWPEDPRAGVSFEFELPD